MSFCDSCFRSRSLAAHVSSRTAEVIYKGAEILASYQLPSGDVLDFINRDTLPALPYDIPPLPLSAEDLTLPLGVEFGLTELEQIPELLELATTATPYHRPTFWPYILGEAPDATSIEDYLARYQVGGQPSGINRLYAGLGLVEPNRGISGFVNQFRPEVISKSFSLIELAVYCPSEGPAQELIGVVISVDKKNPFGRNPQAILDGEPRLHIEYAHLINGQVQFDWDGADGAFVENPIRHHHPGQRVPVSVISGTQVEHLMAIFQVPSGDWWIMYNGDLLGYYPAHSFSMLSDGACRSAWYGEVYNDTPGTTIKTEMGSGKFAEAGVLSAAYVRNPKYYNLSWYGDEPNDDFHMTPYETLCYDRSPLADGLFLLGGPGGKNPGCKWP